MFSSVIFINPLRENIILKSMVEAINDVTAGRKNAVLKNPLHFIVSSFKIVASIRAENNVIGTRIRKIINVFFKANINRGSQKSFT